MWKIYGNKKYELKPIKKSKSILTVCSFFLLFATRLLLGHVHRTRLES